MNIKLNNISNVIHYGNQVKKQNSGSTNTIKPQYSEIPKNSIAELAGRAKVVPFGKSITNVNKTFIEHESSEPFQDKESFSYNKKTGEFVYRVFDKQGLKREEIYSPAEGKEQTTKYVNGAKVVVTKTPTSETIEKFDRKDRQIFYSHSKINGSSTTIESDYEKNRQIIHDSSAFGREIKILDLTTGVEITSGELVYEEIRQQNVRYTKNILTGQIVREDVYDKNENLKSSTEYYESGVKKSETLFCLRDCDYETTEYNEKGIPTVQTTVMDGGKRVFISEYSASGRQFKSQTLLKYDGKGNLISEVSFVPDQDIVDKKIIYTAFGYEEISYRHNPNIAKNSKVYEFDKLIEEKNYFDDGQTVQSSVKHRKDGTSVHTKYTESGIPRLKEQYDSNGFRYSISEYDSITGALKKSIRIDKESKMILETFYGKDKRKVKQIIRDENRQMLASREYYEDGENIKYENEYEKNGAYRKTSYDKNGNILKIEKFDSNGIRESVEKGSFFKNASDESKIDFLKELSDKVSHSNFSVYDLNEFEKEGLASILKLEDSRMLTQIKSDRKLYRKLVKDFHPDVIKSDERIGHYVITILNELAGK